MSDSAADHVPRVSPFNALLGIEVEDLGDGSVRLRARGEDRHRNELGSVHGGLVASLLDGAMGRSVGLALSPGDHTATVELSIQYIAPADGELVAVGRPTRVGGRIAFCEAELRNAEGTLVARAHGTWAIRRAKG